MGLPFPQIIGSVEIEERRPRYWNEPRRKRLNFVKSRNGNHNSKRGSDDWALTPRFQPGQQPRNEAERWDLRQQEAQGRFHQRTLQMDHQRRLYDAQHRQQLMQQQMQQQAAYGQRPPVPPGWGPHGQQQQLPGQHHHHHQQQQVHGQQHMHAPDARPHYASSGDEIIATESGSGGSDSSDGGFSDNDRHRHHHDHHGHRLSPRIKLIEPKHSKPAKQIKLKKDKSGHKKKKNRGGSKHRVYSAYQDSSSSSDEDSFDEALRIRRGVPKPRMSRSRSRARFVDYSDGSSDEPMMYKRITSGKFRGRSVYR